MSADPVAVANSLVARFDRLVRSDGGSLKLIGVSEGTVRVGYKPGVAPDCEDGVCVLPEVELQAMMSEVLQAQAPGLTIEVERA